MGCIEIDFKTQKEGKEIMAKYKLKLDNGETKIVEATTPHKATLKFLGTNYHFKTEAFPNSVRKVILKSKIKKRRTK